MRAYLCNTATDCGRWCERLVKGPGKAQVWCMDIVTGEKVYLTDALADPEFRCPEGRF